MRGILNRFALTLPFALLFASSIATGAAAADACRRPAQRSEIKSPPDLYSQNGELSLTLDYRTTVDQWGRTLFCFETPDGSEAPTLHVNPGDMLKIKLRNAIKTGAPASGNAAACGGAPTPASTNIHFHGLNVSPRCHADDVIDTIVNPGETLDYRVRIPKSEPPCLYWYHQNVAGISAPAVLGGASGAIEVEGIANLQPAVQGLPQRFLLVRDQALANPPKHQHVQPNVPSFDVSLNYVPVAFPHYVPGVIKMQAGAQEFWRLANASANTVMDIQLLYDRRAQPLKIVALDGVPTGSDYGRRQGTIITRTDILVPPGGRAEFIVTGPSTSVKEAMLITRRVNTGLSGVGFADVQRPLARITLTNDVREIPRALLPVAGSSRADGLANPNDSMVTARRTLYFCELPTGGCGRSSAGDKSPPAGGTVYFITVKGQSNEAYNPDGNPNVVTRKGAVEDWTIQNRTDEVHAFHMHQIHFQVIAIDGKPVPPEKRQWYDTYQIGYWDGVAKHYPTVTLRMDFRGNIEGEFIYQDEILDHEDNGAAGKILLQPMAPPKGDDLSLPTRRAGAGNENARTRA
ncbi:MAG TPA: multicopper oxidase domain-containing protein [Rhizomicrobium sp.]|nr:multicopper oxidase domain-containing protein [Rhizomicrobium sp.]